MLDTTATSQQEYSTTDTIRSSDRNFHEVETSTYWLPKDEEEQLRLTGVSIYAFVLYKYILIKM